MKSMNKKWVFYDIDNENANKIADEYGISKQLAAVILNRGVQEEKIATFLNPTRNDFYDPFLMPDMEKAVNRILKAIENKESVLIYGDYDVDGITSITVLKKFLQERGLDAKYYIPNRLDEGYGLNKNALESIKKMNVDLVITVDCGISAIDEVEFGNSLGLEIIITDHHEQLETIPNAYAVINAKRKDSKYPFRSLAGVGTVLKLIQALSIKLNLDDKEYLKYLDIVAIGTISDIVPLVDENRIITKLGLKLLEQTKNIGLRTLIQSLDCKKLDSYIVAFRIAPRINACGRLGYEQEAIKLFFTENINEAKEITNMLSKFNEQRQEIEKHIYDEALEVISNEDIKTKNAIILGKDNWHHGVIGIVASKLTETFGRPTILIGFDGDMGKGSGRSIPCFDLHEALCKTSIYLEQYGGHALAVGLSLKRDNFKSFKESFEQYAKTAKEIQEYIPTIKIDGVINKDNLTYEFINEIKLLEPFGEKNRQPVFIYKNLKINSIRSLSEGKHLKLNLKDDNLYIDAIGFNLGDLADEYLIGDKIDIVGTLSINTFNGYNSLQIEVQDIRKSI